MCMILGKINRVAKTNLYVSVDKKGKRQITVYSNIVDTPKENAMILPVPHPESVELVNLSHYPSLFKDCENCFRGRINITTNQASYALSCDGGTRKTIEVIDVGSYRASIIPSIDDFDRLDRNVFQISPEFITLLKEHYARGFGFIICQLKTGNHLYHPFAYTHALADNGKLFVPTRHFHDHLMNAFVPMRHFTQDNWEKQGRGADWDHILYSPVTNLDTTQADGYDFINTKSIKWDKIPEDYRWAATRPMCRWTRNGDGVNEDIWGTNYAEPQTEPSQSVEPQSWWGWVGEKVGVF
jgi:hypothetical protein